MFLQLLLSGLFFASSVRAHTCVHDEYIASRNISRTVSHQVYVNHPFETWKHANASRRQLSAEWKPLRIHVDSSDVALHNFVGDASAKMQRIISSALPRAIKILTEYLYIVRVHDNLKITPFCRFTINGGKCCGKRPNCKWDKNKCFDVAVPASHASHGIANTDFVIYLTANTASNHGDTVAVGGSCKWDQYDRPLAGQVMINLANIEDSLSANYLTSVLAHELSHALGWTQDSFAKYRDHEGHVRKNVLSLKNTLGKKISLLTTPAVTQHARTHFGCGSLTGLELEDQGGSFTAGSHPEKRIYPESYMAGVTSTTQHSYIIDALALSLFQDSGWYQVQNLDKAGQLSWGRGMGCRVPTHKCNDYGSGANAQGLFCTSHSHPYCTGNNIQVKGYCNIVDYKSALPSYFRYFSSANRGGAIQLADFCPSVNGYSNGDCTNIANGHNAQPKAFGNQYGPESRCFVSSLLSKNYVSKGEPAQARCFHSTCKLQTLEIHIGDHKVSCPRSSKEHTVTVDGFYGSFVCPPYTGLTDSRCRQTCGTQDLACMGIKGSKVGDGADDIVVVKGR